MSKTPSIPQTANELLQSITCTKKKQRRLRSGTFWKKFGIQRRTPEKIAAVKNALFESGITMGLDDGRFGHEKRSDLIILTCVNANLPIEKTQRVLASTKFSGSKIEEVGNASLEVPHKEADIIATLGHITRTGLFPVEETILFSLFFRQFFSNETPSYLLSSGVFGATRSNWTYHTAIAIANATKILNLNCKFEAAGKRDAIIETKGDAPEVILVAEWEWDYDDIFGSGKEIDKLKASCKQFETANAFLFTYCPNAMFLDYVRKISEAWISDSTDPELEPTLFLHVLVFSLSGGVREFIRLKTVAIHPLNIDVWKDIVFD